MKLNTEIALQAATIGAVREATRTALDWVQLSRDARGKDLPAAQGVYAWVERATDAVLYTGKATGQRGLRGRLSLELGDLWKHLDAAPDTSEFDPEDYVPGLRFLYRNDLAIWYAEASTSTHRGDADAGAWHREFHATVRERAATIWEVDPGEPRTGADWEAAILALCARLGDLRSVIGGGSWEATSGSRGQAALVWAHLRQGELGVAN